MDLVNLYCAKKRRKTIFILRAAKLTVLGFVNWQMIGTAICREDWLGIFPRWLCLSSQHHCWWPLLHGVFLVLAKDPLYNTHLNWFGSSQHHMAFVMWCLFSACQRPSWQPSSPIWALISAVQLGILSSLYFQSITDDLICNLSFPGHKYVHRSELFSHTESSSQWKEKEQ